MRHFTLALFTGITLAAGAQNASLPGNNGVLDNELTQTIFTPDSLYVYEPLANDSAYQALLNRPVIIRELDQILAELPESNGMVPVNSVLGPRIFSGYRSIKPRTFEANSDWNKPATEVSALMSPGWAASGWLHDVLMQARISQDYEYLSMVNNPYSIEYTYWDLPVPPRLPEDDVTLGSYIRSLNLPEVSTDDAIIPEFEQLKKHWLHKFSTGLQFSQAYVSKNWYQGGNNYLQLLFNFYWDVQLNPTYHENQIFQSTVNYKLGVNSVEQSAVGRKYSLSEDLFQYNVKYGFKALRKWFYTVTGQFKTQFFTNYKTNTDIRSASFLSPADLNVGLGMTYSHQNKKKTFSMSASIAPISYNLKICLDDEIDHAQFNIKPGHKSHSEIGSSGELNMTWQASSNVSMRTRCFAFTDYTYFQGNVETTWDFAINKFLSTQIYANLRYDSSSDFNISKWHHWMLKEILSFGLTYTFSTK